MAQVLPSGVGESTGDSLLTSTNPLYTSGDIWYVNNASSAAADAASPRGKERLKPLSTLAQAITNSAAGDIIVLGDGHSETLSSAVTINKSLTIIGAGSSSGTPTATLKRSADVSLFTISAPAAIVRFRNIKFGASTASCFSDAITLALDGSSIEDCYFESGDNDAAQWVILLANDLRITGCTFVVTATSTPPAPAVYGGNSKTGILVRNCVFDGGTVGFEDGVAFSDDGANLTDLVVEGITLTRGADFVLSDGSAGWVQASSTGGGRVVLP